MCPFPSPQEYQDAVQNPRLCFLDKELAGGSLVLNRLGLPKPMSGAAGIVFTVVTDSRKFAVKCFTRDVHDLAQRYTAIEKTLGSLGTAAEWRVNFSYLTEGIRVQGRVLPLLKMEYVDGATLDAFIDGHFSDSRALVEAAKQFVAMTVQLDAAGIAHGDFQHGNILIDRAQKMRLIDYDGMFVPSILHLGGIERGHPNYQLPHRCQEDWNSTLDRFSSWVIYTSLIATAEDRSIWTNYHHGGDECLVFRASDFTNPKGSPVLSHLARSRFALLKNAGDLMQEQLARPVASVSRLDLERVPVPVDALGRIEEIMRQGGTVTGEVIGVVAGGLIVDIGLRGFLPASLVALRPVRALQQYVGVRLKAKVIELDRNRNNVVLSRRAYLEEKQAEKRQALLDALQPGEIRSGVVSSVADFGAFVDLGGMDGLVHVSELSWQHVSHPGEAVSVGDKVTVRVLEVDRDRERISLSMRQTHEDPWESFSSAHQVGDVVDGAVTKTVPFGAFVSVTDGVEGLVHVSEIAMHHVESPELELSVGQAVKVKITEIDGDRRRISLSIKQAILPADDPIEVLLRELKRRGIGRR